MTDEKTVAQFVADVASSSPAPGGGSVSALSGSMGAALLEMAVRITGKSKVDDRQDPYLSRLLPVREECLRLIEEDALAFKMVMAAYGLPKGNDEEKKQRSRTIQEALRIATEVPLRTAELCIEVIKSAQEIMVFCKESCLSDAAVGFNCAMAGFSGACANVSINLASLKDEDYRKAVGEKTGAWRQWLEANVPSIEALINERMR